MALQTDFSGTPMMCFEIFPYSLTAKLSRVRKKKKLTFSNIRQKVH